MEDSQSDSENLNVNQRLDFSDLSSDEMEEDTKSDGATKSADNSGEIFFGFIFFNNFWMKSFLNNVKFMAAVCLFFKS